MIIIDNKLIKYLLKLQINQYLVINLIITNLKKMIYLTLGK